jgi:hypothetical protein
MKLLALLLLIASYSHGQNLLANKIGDRNLSGTNRIFFYAFIGDSKATGGVASQPGGWDSKYEQTSARATILYRDNRTSGDESTLRLLTYNPHENRFPGYGVVTDLGAGNYSVGYDNSFVWYMKQNRVSCFGLLKWALGGTTLIPRAGADNDWGVATNEMYRYLVVDYANLAHDRAKNAGYYGSDIKAVFVSLGTNDCFTGVWNNTTFTNTLPVFVDALRKVFGKPNLPIYWQQVRSDLSSHPSGDYTVTAVTQCRAALTAYDATDANFFLLDYESTTSTVDGVHEDATACEAIGLDIGSIFNGL